MEILAVVDDPQALAIPIPGVTVASAAEYLADSESQEVRPATVLNLCRTDRYQCRGYYVSLLAEARGHRPMPDVKLIGDLQASIAGARLPESIAAQAAAALDTARTDSAVVDAFFGCDPNGLHDELCRQLFAVLRAPAVRAVFSRRDGTWHVDGISLLSADDLDEQQKTQFAAAATDYVRDNRRQPRSRSDKDLSMAILYNQDEPNPPSNQAALERLITTSEGMGFRTEIIGRQDIERLKDFDALFIRDMTGVHHYTYQFARTAASEGMVVVDDPDSILKCTNKVYLHELLTRHQIRTPRTLVVHRGNVDQIIPTLGLPCVLKQPDGAFSLGVSRIHSKEALDQGLERLFENSDLLIAQQWLPTRFDWRVGIYDRRPLFVCKYHMAPGHWQVVKREQDRRIEGLTECMSMGEAPEEVVATALRAANLIGDGLYGVDIKESGGQCYVIEVNDNPNVDCGNEDAVLGDALYRELVGVMWRRSRHRKGIAAA